MSINLGDTVKDKLSKIKGTVMSRTEYLYGCVRLGINTGKVHDGKLVDWIWLDEAQCEVVKAARCKKVAPAHGPQPDPIRRRPDRI